MTEPGPKRNDPVTYRDAGVDIDAGNALVQAIKPLVKATRRPGADADLGGFGGLFDLKAAGYRDPVLVAANDGVGTKLRIAIDTGLHDTIGIDLVAMSVNDLVVQGAEPLFFLDYFSCGKLDVETARRVVGGIAEGCRMAGCALIGGETAEMPGMYRDKDFDLAHWLKQNVPESWKLAALRRTWETDPFIHGYLNPAREYALDWNTPGGAPGYGPLTESDDVKAMVARIFGDLPKPESEAGEAGDGAQPDGPILSAQDEAPASEIAALQHETPGGAPDLPLPESPPPQPALQSVRMSEKGGPAARTVDAAPQQEWRDEDHSPPVPRQRRRSGGAIPV